MKKIMKRIIIVLIFLFIFTPIFTSLLSAQTSRTTRALRIGSRIIGGTPGSLLFIDLNKKIAENNAKLFWDIANNRLAIGSTETEMTIGGVVKGSVFTTHSQGGMNAYDVTFHRHSATSGSFLAGARSRGSEASPSMVLDNDNLLDIYGLGYDGTDYEFAAGIRFEIDERPDSDSMPGRIVILTTPNDSTTLVERVRIDCAGLMTVLNGAILNSSSNDNDVRINGSLADNLFFTDASAYRVGIGTGLDAPAELLDVAGNIIADGIFADANVSGILEFGGVGGTNNEIMTLDFETVVNEVAINSTTGINRFNFKKPIRLEDNKELQFGNLDAAMFFDGSGSIDSLQMGLKVNSTIQSGYFSIMEYADLSHANREPSSQTPYPTLRIYSPDENEADDYLEMYHNETDAIINWGNGNLQILGGDMDMQENAITNFGGLHMKSAVEATISSGAITITEGHIRVDTESDDANDDLDTINSSNSGEILFILAADDARTVRIRNGVGNIFLKHQVETKSYSFSSPAGSSGIFYSAGYYNWATADANLDQASPSVTHSAANVASACHIGIVAGGAGVVDTGIIKLTVAGTTIDDNGTRAPSQTIDLVADITTLSTDQYVETTEKFIGQVTIALVTASGSPVNFSLDINHGCSKYEDFGNQAFTVNTLECVGLAGATDTGFNLKLFHHSPTGWTYAATGFVAGGTVLANMNTDYSTEQNLANGESFAYKRINLNTDIAGDSTEGLVLEITTGANKAVEIMDIHIGAHTAPNFSYLADTKQHLIFMKHGGNWLEL